MVETRTKHCVGAFMTLQFVGRWTDINRINDQIVVSIKGVWQARRLFDRMCRFSCFIPQSSLTKDSQEFLCTLTQIAEIEGISLLPPSVHFFQIEYNVLNGLQ